MNKICIKIYSRFHSVFLSLSQLNIVPLLKLVIITKQKHLLLQVLVEAGQEDHSDPLICERLEFCASCGIQLCVPGLFVQLPLLYTRTKENYTKSYMQILLENVEFFKGS